MWQEFLLKQRMQSFIIGMKSEIKINTEVQTRMGYTTKDFIDSNNFPEMKLISDNSEITTEIKGTRIIAVPDMEKFLGG